MDKLDEVPKFNKLQSTDLKIKISDMSSSSHSSVGRTSANLPALKSSLPIQASNPFALNRLHPGHTVDPVQRSDHRHQDRVGSHVGSAGAVGGTGVDHTDGATSVAGPYQLVFKREESEYAFRANNPCDELQNDIKSDPSESKPYVHDHFPLPTDFPHQNLKKWLRKSDNAGFAEREMKKFNQSQAEKCISMQTVHPRTLETKVSGVREACTMTDSPSGGVGSRINLDGLVLNETDGGLLVVNVLYNGRDYMGTLMDCTTPVNSWASPRHSETPPPDKRPKKKKVKGESDIELSARASLRNRRNNQRRQRKTRKRKWEENKNHSRLEK